MQSSSERTSRSFLVLVWWLLLGAFLAPCVRRRLVKKVIPTSGRVFFREVNRVFNRIVRLARDVSILHGFICSNFPI